MYFKNMSKTLMRLEQLERNGMKVKKLQALMLATCVAVCSVTPKHYAKIVQMTPLFYRPNRARSSQVLQNSMLQITRCLDFASDNYQAGEINTYS